MNPIRDKKDLDAFVSRMAAGKSAAASKRVSSTAPPTNNKSARPSKAAQNLNAVTPPPTKLPKPAKKSGVTVPSQAVGPSTAGSKKIVINIHN